jgi:hypothetical protein
MVSHRSVRINSPETGLQILGLEREIEHLTSECTRLEQEIARIQIEKSRPGSLHVEQDRLSSVSVSSERFRNREIDREPEFDRRFDLEANQSSKCRKEMKTPTFDGSCEISEFFMQFDEVARWNGWTMRECASQLITSLKGTARQILSEISPTITDDFYALKETLRARYNPRERESAYKVEFKTKRRQIGQSVSDYGHALRRLAIKAYPNCAFGSLETHIIDQFIYGLGDVDLRKHVQFNHPSTIDKAIALAVEYESFVGKCDEVRKPNMNRVRFDESSYRPQESVDKVDIAKLVRDEIQRTLGSRNFTANPQEYRPRVNEFQPSHTPIQAHVGSDRRSQIVCHNCKTVGHIAPRCPLHVNRMHNNIQPSQRISNPENSQGLSLGPGSQS